MHYEKILKILVILILIIALAISAFFIDYAVKANRSNETRGKTETQYTTDETGSIIINIPYDKYIEKCDAPEEYIIPDISENNSGKKNSSAVNEAVNVFSENGGGTVYIPQGKYKGSTIELKSNVTLFISENAELISLDYNENSESASPLFGGVITAHDAENITITGGGTISGCGESYTDEPETEEPLYALEEFNTYTRVIEARKRIRFGKKDTARNPIINLSNCTNAKINNVILSDSAGWTCVVNGGSGYDISNVVIDNNMHVANTDGIDILNCSDVTIKKCFIATGDDAIVLKAIENRISNVKVYDCEMSSFANCFKIGTETAYDIDNVTVNNCSFFLPDGMTYGYSGIAVESADGSNISNVSIDNIHMDGISSPILIWLGNRMNYGIEEIGSIDKISISNVTAENTEMPSAITGCKADGKTYNVGNVTLNNINVTYRDTKENLSVIKPVPDWSMNGYPDIVRISHKYFINHDFSGYWDLPCYGIFIRYADVDYSGYSCTPRQSNTRDFAYIKN